MHPLLMSDFTKLHFLWLRLLSYGLADNILMACKKTQQDVSLGENWLCLDFLMFLHLEMLLRNMFWLWWNQYSCFFASTREDLPWSLVLYQKLQVFPTGMLSSVFISQINGCHLMLQPVLVITISKVSMLCVSDVHKLASVSSHESSVELTQLKQSQTTIKEVFGVFFKPGFLKRLCPPSHCKSDSTPEYVSKFHPNLTDS